MNIGIVGLGLIGGSLAKAFSYIDGVNVWGDDNDRSVTQTAIDAGAITGQLTDDNIKECDYIIVALYPQATIDYVKANHKKFKDDVVIMDTCGVKEVVCNELFPFAEKNDFTFVGTHPMAGIEKSGFQNSFADLFYGASIIIVPDNANENSAMIDEIEELFRKIGFGRIEITTPENHDRMIGYTSQLAHVVSSAYVKNPFAVGHKGFSAGSFHDMTRVAKLNEDMWTELFLDNKDNLVQDIDRIISELAKYKEAIEGGDRDELRDLLKAGRVIREELTK